MKHALGFRFLGFAAVALAVSSSAWAAEYECRVYCKDPDGQASVTVRADSKSDAAQIVDRQGHDICKRAGHGRATSSTMSPSQCSPK